MAKTYNDLYIALRNRLKAAGVEASALEARILVAFAAEKSPAALLADLRLYTSPEVEERVEELAQMRLEGEPVAYLTGSWEFYGLEMRVGKNVLIPRPDTEVLVDQALELVGDRDTELRILDLCTGSGCIGCALGHFLPKSHVIMADNSYPALGVAKENAANCGLGVRGICIEADATAPPSRQLGTFDLIVSNPPYIASSEIETLDASVRDYEPRSALDGGPDGLLFYREILKYWKPLLRPGGWLLFEVGETQAADVEYLMRASGLRGIGFAKDTAGYDRVVYGKN